MKYDAVVVGGGVWGESVRECLQEAGKSVCLIYDHDDAERQAASDGPARIIRAEYADDAHRQFANRAIELFHTQDPFCRYYHKSGWFLIRDLEDKRYESIPGSGEWVSLETMMRYYPEADLDEHSEITTTSKVGWVEASRLQGALHNPGSTCGKVSGVLSDGTTCYGVRLEDDTEIHGTQVILATGWRTNELLRSCALPTLVYDIVGAATMGVQLSQEQYAKYKDMKILCKPGDAEILPPTRDRVITVNNGRTIRFPEGTKFAPRVESTHPCFKESKEFLKKYLPDLVECPIVMSRICMDALTEGQTFSIKRDHSLTHLHCVGGGSFHSWKFRPVLPVLLRSQLFGLETDDDLRRILSQAEVEKHAGVVPTRHWAEEF